MSQSLVKVQPIARLNAVLVVSRKPALLRTAATWISRLDKSGDGEHRRQGLSGALWRRAPDRAAAQRHVHRRRRRGGALDSPTNQIAPGGGTTVMSSAERLTGGPSSPTTSGLRQVGATATAIAAPAPPQRPFGQTSAVPGAGALGGPRGATGPGTPLLANVRITADVVNNALLIYANQENYRIIEQTLHQLDRPQLQVAIDATIAEITLNDNLNYGVQFFLKSSDVGLLPPDTGSIINSAAGALLGRVLPGFNFLVGSESSPRVILDALHGVTDVKVLSNPSLVVLDNQAATLQVGDQVPFSTGTATVLTANNTVVNTIDYRNTGIILRVVPRINANGNVVLDIEQEISNVAAGSAASLTPTISQRKVKSSIAVASGQTVLLAGLISETQNRRRSGIPILDQIPGVGDVFTQNNKGLQRTELIIFIRPQIIRDSVDACGRRRGAALEDEGRENRVGHAARGSGALGAASRQMTPLTAAGHGRRDILEYAAVGLLALAAASAAIVAVPGLHGLLGAGLALLMLAIAAIDARHFVIPDELTAAALGLGLVNAATQEFDTVLAGLGSAVLRGAVLAACFLAVRAGSLLPRGRGVRLGDVKWAGPRGSFWVGFPPPGGQGLGLGDVKLGGGGGDLPSDGR